MKINEKNKLKKFLTKPSKYDIIYMYLSDTKKTKRVATDSEKDKW